MSTVYAAVAAIVLLAVLIPTTIHLVRAHNRARRLPPITEAEAREHSRPLSYAILSLAPTNPPPTEEPKCQDSR